MQERRAARIRVGFFFGPGGHCPVKFPLGGLSPLEVGAHPVLMEDAGQKPVSHIFRNQLASNHIRTFGLRICSSQCPPPEART